MYISRRDFLKYSAASLACLAGSMSFPSVMRAAEGKREFIMICDSDIPSDPQVYVPRTGFVNGMEVATGEAFSIPTPVFGHVVDQNPVKPEQVLITERWGPKGVVVDIKDRKVLTVFDAAPKNVFFGHSVFTADSATLISTEQEKDTGVGYLVLRDVKTMKILQKMDSYGMQPHECRSYDGGKTLLVANSRGAQRGVPNMSWIDIQSGKQLRKVDLPNESVFYSHFDTSYDGWICLIGSAARRARRERFNLIKFISPDGKVFTPELPPEIATQLRREILSLAFVGKSGLVAVTNPVDKIYMVFDYKKQKLVDFMNLDGPTGIVADLNPARKDKGVLVALNSTKRLVSIDAVEGEKGKPSPVASAFGGIGSHMSRIYL